MIRRDPRWQVTYLLRGRSAQWTVRAPSECAAIEAVREWRAAFDLERGLPDESSFDIAFATPYTTSDAMDDGTSVVSVAILLGLASFMVLAFLGFNGAGGRLASVAAYGWLLLEVMCFVGFVGYVLFGLAGLVYAGVSMLRQRDGRAG